MIKIKFERHVKLGECFVSGSGLLSYGRSGKREMLLTELGRRIVKDIDNGIVQSKDNILLPEYDTSIPPSELAGGTQGLIYLMSEPKKPIRLNCFGRNCYKYIWEIAGTFDHDILFSTTGRNQMLFDFAPQGAKALCLNDGEYIYNSYQFDAKAYEYVKYEIESLID